MEKIGFYSTIQFVPDLDRGETANVGLVLVVPGDFAVVRMATTNDGPKKLFGARSFDERRLSHAKKAICARLNAEIHSWESPKNLVEFASKEANHMRIAPPRTIITANAQQDVERLFANLVFVKPVRRTRARAPNLKAKFADRLIGLPIQTNLAVELPTREPHRVPYAYQNGALNLVQAEGFSRDERAATAKADTLAVLGGLIHKFTRTNNVEHKLVVVGAFAKSLSTQAQQHIDLVFKEHHTRLVREEDLPAFVDEVRDTLTSH